MAESIPNYEELKLRLKRDSDGTYQVLAFGPDGSTAAGTFALPFTDLELDNFVLRVGAPRRTVRGHRSSEIEEAKRFGSALADALLQGQVGELFGVQRHVTQERGRGLRITLYLTDAPDLVQVPWEFLYRDRVFLSHSIFTPVVRSLDLPSVSVPRKVTPPLRILGMVSSPHGFARLDVEDEKRKLEQALDSLRARGLVELNWLEEATAAALDRFISAPDEEHILHYIGHGEYDPKTEAGILILEDRDGRAHEFTGDDLCALLQDERSLRLVVLNSCEGARTSHVDPFSGVASSLLHCGIPAVVGMQFEITDGAAITFSDRFYTSMAQGYPVDAALAQARKAIFAAGHEIEFGTPVLFLRGTDTKLFKIEHADGTLPIASAPTPMGTCDFTVRLDQRPAEAGAGDQVTWALTIENTGTSALRDLTARSDTGELLADPVDLAPAHSSVIRWKESADSSSRHVVTVTASDPEGKRLSEQVTGEVILAGESEEEPRKPAIRDESHDNRNLFDSFAGKFENNLYDDQRAALRSLIADDERLLGMCRCGRPSDIARHIAILITSERLLWARKTPFSEATSGVVRWSDVLSVTEKHPMGFELTLRGGDTFALDSFQGKGVRIVEDRRFDFGAEALRQWITRRIEGAAPSPPPEAKGWSAQLVARGDRFRELRVKLDHDEHVVKYETGFLTDKLVLDGETLYTIWNVRQSGYELVLTDDDRARQACLKVELSGGGQRITGLSLDAEGALLYEE